VNNFYGKETEFVLPDEIDIDGYSSTILISNYEDSPKEFQKIQLRPYESIVYHLTK
jgi:trehalose-6-phosphate hydrolase